MVYGVFGGYYSDWYVVGYFNNREDADKYCCVCGNGNYYVKPLKDLMNERDLSNIKLKYMHEIFLLIKITNGLCVKNQIDTHVILMINYNVTLSIDFLIH